MKAAILLISSLLMGLMFKNVRTMRRRFLGSVVFAAMAFVFIMAAILLGTVDSALQLEGRGTISWSAMLGVAAVFLGAGGVCLLAAKLIFPRPRVNDDFLALIEQFAQGFAAGAAAPQEPSHPPHFGRKLSAVDPQASSPAQSVMTN